VLKSVRDTIGQSLHRPTFFLTAALVPIFI
jgi:hypothetical protein